MVLIQISFLLFIFLKQFYIFSSGGLQPSDILFLISFGAYIFYSIKKQALNINKIDKYMLMFVFMTTSINIFYFCIYLRGDFLMSSFYYVYNLFVVILFNELIKDFKFIKNLLKIVKISLWVQTLIYFLGLGRYYEGIRYMGTFNDPNQMAFYIYMLFMIIVILSDILEYKLNIFYKLITIFLVLETGSTGILLGISSFWLIYLILKILTNKMKIQFNKKIPIIVTSISFIFIIIMTQNIDKVISKVDDATILKRLEQKISEISSKEKSNNEETIIRDRGIDKLMLYPEKLLLGSGQGYYGRFSKAYHQAEVHSTLPSILFYYGIIPTIIIVIWFIKSIQYVPKELYAIYISLIIESFTLLNQRQPFFWILFVLGRLYVYKMKNFSQYTKL
ncbi:hypothetical protein [Paraclostridium sordellii]|uniref:hypothetical protein n=2 Tax=Paraclostridium sordellii TaxID=1505 RepID=UPI0005E6ABC0|nr:hypothetical protein [Paeniclostridium sordellii]CEN89201.1 Uncharacterised protein [[Clostridium] sordellii] [Paeniclostridium sordellii]CEQ13049.1 Uncharacterised protein [[Clostridium] sordellii] [Paeniclostridium sordellii]